MAFRGLRDCRIQSFKYFVLLNTPCSNESFPSGCLFVHLFDLIFIVAIRREVHFQHKNCFICMKISGGHNLLALLVASRNWFVPGSCISILFVSTCN